MQHLKFISKNISSGVRHIGIIIRTQFHTSQNNQKHLLNKVIFYDYSDIYFNKLHTLKLSRPCVREYGT